MAEQGMVIKESVRLEKYRNDEIINWIDGFFGTDKEKAAAFETFAHICDHYPVAYEAIRGDLIGVSECEMDEDVI